MHNDLLDLIAGKIDLIAVELPLGGLEFVELDMDTMDRNGWQVDYWVDGTFQDVDLKISGSMFYGTLSIVRA